MTTTKLILKPICRLSNEIFYIPAYQRGYRWGPAQVIALLDDIWRFRAEKKDTPFKEVFYCLQPLVVSPSPQGWIVIDGQQRLTTILLIITYLQTRADDLDNIKFSISYETRPESQSFIENIGDIHREDNIDYYHMSEAFNSIKAWFKSKGPNTKINFQQTFLNDDDEGKNVKVIWYQVDESETATHIDIFTRLNIGKIPLTSAELIKAFLLQKEHFPIEKADVKQIQIATEWDYIERMLQRDEFWYFIYDAADTFNYENRIEYIFDRMFDRQKDTDYYHTFYAFISEENLVKDSNGQVDIGAMWIKVKQYFQVLEDWFSNNELYHLVGYLICCGYRMNKLKADADKISKDKFKEILNEKIKNTVNFQIVNLEYNNDRAEIKRLLLLFNIQTLLKSEGESRFPFDLFKTYDWDIEHINSQTERDIDKRYRKDWMADIVKYFTGLSIEVILQNKSKLDDLKEDDGNFCKRILELYSMDAVNEVMFSEIKQEIANRFDADLDDRNKYIDSIGNLTLLDSATNRSYKNAFFPIKRQHIIENDSIGKFVPICTKNVFLKYYADRLGDVMHWKESDALSYTNAIFRMLENYLPSQEM
ncbi:DUF262 domain-containing protein [Chitinophaga sp. Cy-1792]|uniref:DUF262 domain-containing protein n=1 Tax=Chitinophaga sp. Cy-1792 TaxID=2608339 RepID=UPI0014231D72|nr:DUF262 domain-containing protein [Chitinophaga sp. Cy-1792]NIG55731.1 DUF262 domain-containing protein [Chitinophaga sp. Cy-1792]